MKIVSFSMIKNESDFIERFIRINSQIVDRFFIADDNSCDETVSILQNLIEEGFAITMVSLETEIICGQWRHDEVMSQLMHYVYNSSEEKPDFVIPLDADELLFLNKKKLEIKLSQLQPGQYAGMKWTTFVPCVGSLTNQDLLKEKFFPLRNEQCVFFKPIIPSNLVIDSEFMRGNHALKNNPYRIDLNIDLCHFPVRSENQIIAKALLRDARLSLKRDKEPTEGYHIIQLANEIRKNKYCLTETQLEDCALGYLGKKAIREFKIVQDFLDYEENLPKYTPKNFNLIAAFDSFIFDIINQ